jgi:hypothetical protein
MNNSTKLQFISYANFKGEMFDSKTKYLVESAKKYNININFVGTDEKNFKYICKLYEYSKVINDISTTNPDDIIACIDSTDVMIFDYPENILENFYKKNCDILFSSERHYCHQVIGDNREVINYYAHINLAEKSDYMFLNSGTFIGYANKLAKFLSDLLDFFKIEENKNVINTIQNGNNDQTWVGYFVYRTNAFKTYNLLLDYNNSIFYIPYSWKNINETEEIDKYIDKNLSTIVRFNNKERKLRIIHITNISHNMYLAETLLKNIKKLI